MNEALIASSLAGLATGLGAIPLLIFKDIPHHIYDGLLGLAAGIMLSAASFSLILPAISEGGVWQAVIGILLGGISILYIDILIPHLEPHFSLGHLNLSMKRGILMAIAITIHNFPEGFAVGVGYSSGTGGLGLTLAIAIAIQNIPEGLAVAAPLKRAGVGRWNCLLLATASGLAEPIAAICGIIFLGLISRIMPLGLAFAGGAMIYVVSEELIPESHSHGNERYAAIGIIIGFIIMIILQEIFS